MTSANERLERWMGIPFRDSAGMMRILRILGVIFFPLLFGFMIALVMTTQPLRQLLALLLNFALYFLITLSAILIAFYYGAKYVQDIYELEDTKKAMGYLWICMYGFFLPKLKISGGHKKLEEEHYHSMEKIGGPGKLQVDPGNAVVLETLEAHTRVVGSGTHTMTRFEKIKDALLFEDQFGEIDKVEALTRDGVEVAVLGVQYRFRIDAITKEKDEETLSLTAPLSFSKRAVTQLSYQRAVGDNHHFSPWEKAVEGKIRGIISEQINNTDLDTLVTPHILDGHPLDELRKKLNTPATRDQFKGMGIRLLSCNIGQLAMTSDKIDKQLVEAWFAKKEGVARVVRAQSESENFISQERGRAEGQAMLLKNISRALEEIDMHEKPAGQTDKKEQDATRRKNLRNILLARTAQILESRTSIYQSRQDDKETKHDNKG